MPNSALIKKMHGIVKILLAKSAGALHVNDTGALGNFEYFFLVWQTDLLHAIRGLMPPDIIASPERGKS
jgi:hypothetical protein